MIFQSSMCTVQVTWHVGEIGDRLAWQTWHQPPEIFGITTFWRLQLSILDMGDGDHDDLFSPPWYVASSPNQQYLDKSVNYEAGSFWDRSFKVIFTIATWYGKSYVERSQQNWTGYTTIMIMLMWKRHMPEMKVDDINCKDTSNEAYECFWPVLSSCHLEEAFLSRLFPGTHSEPIFCIYCFLRLVCRSKSFTFIHRQIASWPLARDQLSKFSSMIRLQCWWRWWFLIQ